MASSKASTHFWTDEETRFMLTQVQDLNILKFMDGRKTRNAYLFKKMSVRMEDAGFVRTPEQIRIKWKNIRQAYNSAKQSGERRGFPFYELLEELLGRRTPRSPPPAAQHGLDVGFGAEYHREIKSEMDKETSTETGVYGEPVDGDTPKHEDDSAGSTESTRRTSPWQGDSQGDSELPGPSVHPPGRRQQQQQQRRWRVGDGDIISRHMDEMREFWREQMKESDAWQERLLTTIMDNNTTMVAALLEGIKSLRPPAPPPPPTTTTPPSPPTPPPAPAPPPAPVPAPCVCQVVVHEVKREEESYEAVGELEL